MIPLSPALARARLAEGVGAFPRAFWMLWVGTLVNRLGLVVLPFLTLYLTEQRGLTPGRAASLVALFGAGSLVANLVGGTLADRVGRRTTMIASLLGGAAVLLAIPYVRGLLTLGAAVTLMGLFGEMYRPAVSAAVADVVPEERRARAYALLYWVVNVGAAVAPVIGGFLATRSFTALFVLDAATMAGYALVVGLGLPETRPNARARRAGRPHALAAFRDPAFAGLSALGFLVGLVFFQAFTTLPLAMRAQGLTPADYGTAIAVNGVLVVALSLPIARGAERRPPLLVLACAAVLIGTGFGLHAPAVSFLGFAIGVVVWTFGEMAFFPVVHALVARLAPLDLRGAYQGAYGAAWGVGILAGPALGGLLIDRSGPSALWAACAGVGLTAAVGFLLLHHAYGPSVGPERGAAGGAPDASLPPPSLIE